MTVWSSQSPGQARDLTRFACWASDDVVKRDLELTCSVCRQVLCDVEDGDTLSVLVSVAQGHVCGKPEGRAVW